MTYKSGRTLFIGLHISPAEKETGVTSEDNYLIDEAKSPKGEARETLYSESPTRFLKNAPYFILPRAHNPEETTTHLLIAWVD